jgi:hypothetical protein
MGTILKTAILKHKPFKHRVAKKSISPVRIAVLHEVANLDLSGWAGSTPGLGVFRVCSDKPVGILLLFYQLDETDQTDIPLVNIFLKIFENRPYTNKKLIKTNIY